jgi:hypothetical protein
MEWTVLPNTLTALPGGSGNFAALDQEHERIVFYLTSPLPRHLHFGFISSPTIRGSLSRFMVIILLVSPEPLRHS